MKMHTLSLYLAAGLFNAGERLHNLYLEKHLKLRGYTAILPQREALNFFNGDQFDVKAIVRDCQQKASSKNNLLVGNADGTDADSGTAVEYGMAITATGQAIIYRTDFRTVMEKEIGLNAMLNANGTTLIYEPCYFTELDEVDAYYAKLAEKIDIAVSATEHKT